MGSILIFTRTLLMYSLPFSCVHISTVVTLPTTKLIVLIPKPGQDILLASSYCPISLIPTETKLIGKILTDHLMNHICSIIHPNQTGLMPGRNMFFNLRCLFDVLYAKSVQS